MLLTAAMAAQAQDTYLNDRLTNTAGDVYGTARFVGMGGAMGALGADLSTINWNPAGLGLFRKSDLAVTAGAVWDNQSVPGVNKAHATLDQLGGVYAIPINHRNLQFFNIGFNYQKKLNFCNAFTADHNNLGGMSQMTQLAGIAYEGFDTDYNLAGFALDNEYTVVPYYISPEGNGTLTPIRPSDDAKPYKYAIENKYRGDCNRYTQYTTGSLNAFDFNISSNISNRTYLGVTLGFENMHYRAVYDYYEESHCAYEPNKYGDYSLYNDQAIDGFGFNIKFGAIVRPVEESPLRVALAVETPTWYQLNSSTYYQLTDHVSGEVSDMPESYLEYSVRTPWKVRVGVGSTVGNFLAWDVDYEYANYSTTRHGYPNEPIGEPHNTIFGNTWDKDMDEQTSNNLKATHNVRAGVEYKLTPQLSARFGYNFATSAYKNNPTYDQMALNSYSMDYATTTSYMRVGNLNCLSLGLGYRWKYAYIDVAYKLKNQKADFYGFYYPSDVNVGHSPNLLTPVNADLTKHQLTATLGFKF